MFHYSTSLETYVSLCVFTCFLHRYEYHWADGTNIKKPIKCSAPKYIDYLMTWVQDQLDDETLFPSKIGDYADRFYLNNTEPLFIM